MSRYKVLALAWRPKSFEQVVGQPHVVTSLSNAISLNKIPQCLLFTGTRGVGKTTIARILAKCLNCVEGPTATPCQQCDHCLEIDAGRFPDLFEVDAASRTKVEDTRELLENIPYAPSKGRFKVYLIDEVHMLSAHSFNALLKTLEEPPEHVVFLLATTDPQKLPATVLSRCLQFKLQSMSPEQVNQHIQHILSEEGIAFDAEATPLIAQAANGSMRDALSLLDQAIAHGNGEVRTVAVREMLGTIDTQPLCQLLEALAEKNGEKLIEQVAQLRKAGVDFLQALRELSALLQEMAVAQVIGDNASRPIESAILSLSQQFAASEIQQLYQVALKGIEEMPFALSAETGFEMTLLAMLTARDTAVPQPAAIPAQAATPRATPAARPSAAVAPSPAQTAPTQAHPAQTAKPAPARPQSSTQPTSTGGDEWSQIVPHLQVRGLTLVLAQNCRLKEKQENRWVFTLDRKQQPLVQKRTEDTLTQALSAHLGQSLSIQIEIVDQEIEPLAAPAAAPAQATQAAPSSNSNQLSVSQADSSVHQDPEVQRVMQTFSGKLDDQRVVKSN